MLKPNTARRVVKTPNMDRSNHLRLWLCAVLALFSVSCTDSTSRSTVFAGSSTTSDASGTTVVTVATTPAPTTEPPPPGPEVDPDTSQEGLVAPLWDDTAYGEEAYRQVLAEVAEIGAEWVTIVPTWYQDSATSSEIYPEESGRTATDESLVTAIREARALGLEVMLKPHVDIVDGGSRLEIVPEDAAEWFERYREMILHYAAIAATEDVGQFVVGTELAGTIEAEDQWRHLVEEVRAVYPGPLTYAANHDSYGMVPFWDVLDVVGIDAYFPLAEEPTDDVAQLTESWENIAAEIEELATSLGRRVILTEVGYPSQEGAVTRPFDPAVSSTESVDEQDAALRAMMGALDDEPWFAGFHWWMWFEERTPEEQALGYTPKGKPAGETLRERWSGG